MIPNRRIRIIDYGMGNLFSVHQSFSKFTNNVAYVTDKKGICEADILVIPGVGAFCNAMSLLAKQGLIEPIKDFFKSGKPILGICLGMQLFMTSSKEFGNHLGLDLISGEVVPIDRVAKSGEPFKVPHIGWNKLILNERSNENKFSASLKQIKKDDFFYFVHSFHCIPKDARNNYANSRYNGTDITAVVGKENLLGVQFHPEKSGESGLRLILEFITNVI